MSTSSFAESIMRDLSTFAGGLPKLISDSFDEEYFGNAEAIIVLDEVRLRFVDDRGLRTVAIGLPSVPGSTVFYEWPLETLAVALGWIGLDDLLAHYRLRETDAGDICEKESPPGPFYELDIALAVMKDRWNDLVAARDNPDVRTGADLVHEQLTQKWIHFLNSRPQSAKAAHA